MHLTTAASSSEHTQPEHKLESSLQGPEWLAVAAQKLTWAGTHPSRGKVHDSLVETQRLRARQLALRVGPGEPRVLCHVIRRLP